MHGAKTRSSAGAQIILRLPPTTLWKSHQTDHFPLAQRLGEGVEKGVEISVTLPEFFDLPHRVDDGRMMFSTEAAADLGKRGIRESLAEIHRNLARHRHRLRVVPGLQFGQLQL